MLSILSIVLSAVMAYPSGVVGEAVESSYNGRLSTFVSSSRSEAISLFERDSLSTNLGWRGEHAGKWLYAASLAFERTRDPELGSRLQEVADHLVSLQEADGYLGCYIPSLRFYDDPSEGRTNVSWDLWINTYMLKGLVAASRALSNPAYLDAAGRIADLMYDTFIVRGRSIAESGHHTGLVGLGSIEPLTELYEMRPEKRYKDLILKCVEEMDSAPGLGLVTILRNGQDVALAGDAKIYETLRCLTGLARWAHISSDRDLLLCCRNAWECIRKSHLTPLGGPWGGVRVNAEVFNRDCCFSPYQVTETCSSMEWMHFNAEMLRCCGGKEYADEIEKTFYNAILGARNADGLRWVYYTRTNGLVGPGNEWSCCWSSGMIAMEDISRLIYSQKGREIFVNVYADCDAEFDGGLKLAQSGDYAHTGTAVFTVGSDSRSRLRFRVPEWAESCRVELDGKAVKTRCRKGYLTVPGRRKAGEVISLSFPMEPRLDYRTRRYECDGKFSVRLMKTTGTYVALSRGPLVYCIESEDSIENPSTPIIDSSDVASITERFSFVPFYEYASTTESPTRTIWIEVK